MDIKWIIDAIHSKKLRITDHAYEEAESDGLSYDEIYASVLNGEIIEDYPDNSPYPSALFLGWVAERFPHLVREAAARGHEIASHGYAHELVFRQLDRRPLSR